MTRITKHTTKEINYYTILHDMQEYRVEEIKNGALTEYEIYKVIGNKERSEILKILRDAQKQEERKNERK